MTGHEEAARALHGIRDAQTRLAGRARWSMARHLAFAGLMTAVVAGLALPPILQMLLTVGLLLCVALTVRRDKARDGMFVNGWRTGRTVWVTLPTVAVIVALAIAAVSARIALGLWWAPLAAAAVVLPIGLGASLLWEHVYREELGA